MARPLLHPPADDPASPEPGAAEERLRKRKDDAIAALRDAEFDFRLGKLSEADYQDLRSRLEGEALRALAELDAAAGRPRETT